MSFGGTGMPEAVTSEGALEKVNERSRIRYPLPAEYAFKNYLLRISDLFCLSFLLDKLRFSTRLTFPLEVKLLQTFCQKQLCF